MYSCMLSFDLACKLRNNGVSVHMRANRYFLCKEVSHESCILKGQWQTVESAMEI